jgi:peptidoglycan/xylan/chitin deacetylase (PgdA/CDA1 family)
LNDAGGLDPSLISATPAVFEQQMCYLAKHYRVVSVEEVLHSLDKGDPLPGRTALVTFDDAYREFAEVAWPVLKHYRVPAVLFVPTAYPDQPDRSFWWDRLYRALTRTSRTEFRVRPVGTLLLGTAEARRASLRQIQNYVKTSPHGEAMALVHRICEELDEKRDRPASVLTWDELRRLAKEGVTLGAHTRTHPILTRVSAEQAREEIGGSQQDLKRKLGRALPIFCYPGGAHNSTVVRIAMEAGIKMAFTTRDGQNDLAFGDPLRLRRTNITPRTSLPVFRLRLTRLVSYLDVWRHRKHQWAATG